jgi:RNA-directed DNA polymerase
MIADSPYVYTDSPHMYRRLATESGIPESVISASLENAQQVESKGLPAVLTLNHLAYQTGAAYGYLRGICERADDRYTDLSIKRHNGRPMRAISVPDPVLMQVQRWILEMILSVLPVHCNSYAYTAGRSIRHCAKKHLGAKWFVKLDIRDFFPSIDEAQVYSVFRDAGYEPLISLELARICTRYVGHVDYIEKRGYRSPTQYTTIRAYNRPLLGFLPQGAPTSGALANQAATKFDVKLTKLADSYGLTYTRYADDLTFSSSHAFDRDSALRIVKSARKILRSEHFVMHEQKTAIVPPGARKIVLGLLVDGDRIRINRKMRTRINNHIRGVEVFGLAPHKTHANFSSIDGLVRHVSGLLAFAKDIEPGWATQMQDRWHAALHANYWMDIPAFPEPR